MSENTNTWAWYTVTFLVAGVFVFLSPDAAHAQQIGGVICDLSGQLTGATAKAMATLAIIGIGAMALFGKSSWGSVFVVGAAVALVFGAGSIVTMIGGQAACGNASPPFQFACNNGNAQGNLFSIDTLVQQPTDVPDSVFAHTLFFFKNTVGQVMSSMYCVISNAMIAPFRAAMTLFIVVFGIMITTGMTNFTMKEAAVVLFKIALIWMFAMNATAGIGIGYRFFMNFAEEATNIVLGAIPKTGGIVPSITAPDAVITGMFSTTITGAQGTGTAGPTLSSVPQVCLLTLAIFAALLLFFMPFVIFFVAMLVLGYIGNFARAMLNYLTSLVLISFLFIFAPFFICFALFKTTMPLFESWIKHVVSYSLQMVVMFAFMAMLSLLPVVNFFTMILSLMKEYNKTFDFPATGTPLVSYTMHWCGVCQFAINQNSNFSTDQNANDIACVLHRGATVAEAAGTAPGYMLSVDGNFFVISLWNLVEHTDLAKYLIIQVLALWLISRAIGELMRRAPELAKQLGGLASAAALGGGGGGGQGPGIGYIGLESIQAGFMGMRNGMLRGGLMKRDWTGRMKSGLKEGIEGVKHGTYNERSLEGKQFQNKLKRREKELEALKARTDTVSVINKLEKEKERGDKKNKELQDKMTLNRDQLLKAQAAGNTEEIKKLKNEQLSLEQALAGQQQAQQTKREELQKELTKAEQNIAKHDRQTLAAVQQYNKLLEKRAETTDTAELAAMGAQLQQALDQAGKRNNEALLANLEREVNSMKQQGAGGAKKGLMEIRDESGLVVRKSSLSNPDYNNETTKKEQEMAQKHRMKKIYGAVEKPNPNNTLGVMDMPQDIYTGPSRKTMQEMKQHVTNMIESEREILADFNLAPEKARELERAIEIVESHNKNANSAGQMKHVTEEAAKIKDRINHLQPSEEPASLPPPIPSFSTTNEPVPVAATTSYSGNETYASNTPASPWFGGPSPSSPTGSQGGNDSGLWNTTPAAPTGGSDSGSWNTTPAAPVSGNDNPGLWNWNEGDNGRPTYTPTTVTASGGDGANAGAWGSPASGPAGTTSNPPPVAQQADGNAGPGIWNTTPAAPVSGSDGSSLWNWNDGDNGRPTYAGSGDSANSGLWGSPATGQEGTPLPLNAFATGDNGAQTANVLTQQTVYGVDTSKIPASVKDQIMKDLGDPDQSVAKAAWDKLQSYK